MLWNGFVFLVRGFECVKNQILNTPCKGTGYTGKNAPCTKSGPFGMRPTRKLVTVKVELFPLKEKRQPKPTKNSISRTGFSEKELDKSHGFSKTIFSRCRANITHNQLITQSHIPKAYFFFITELRFSLVFSRFAFYMSIVIN